MGDDVPPLPPDACTGIECQVVNCAAKGMPDTTISGTVFAPNGTLALHGVTVYVPLLDPPPFEAGVKCTRCESQLPGAAVAVATSGIDGKFTLAKAPSGSAVPLIITIGKWRRKVVLPAVAECTDNPLPANLTSLPKNKSEGELPKIAMASGGCDRLECLIRKLGVSDSEFTHDGGNGSIHLYDGGGLSSAHTTALQADAALTGDINKLKNYDIAMWSCDCSEGGAAKTKAMMDNVKAYADVGGRLFFSHYNSVWIGGDGTDTPQVWPTVATCDTDNYPSPSTQTGIIDQASNPKGPAFASWLQAVGGSTTLGQLSITDTRQTCSALDASKGAERWVHLTGGELQNFQFTTPAEVLPDQRCGKVVMSDMHVSGSGTSGDFPGTCGAAGGALTPQEKALAFMFFDIASCVGDIL